MALLYKNRNGMLATVDCSDWHDLGRVARLYLQDAKNDTPILGNYLFRGHSHWDWPLMSSFDRLHSYLSREDANSLYHRMINEFGIALDNYGDLDGKHVNYLSRKVDISASDELEAIAQHFGLRTRLLDWSFSLYVAAFFAFSNPGQCVDGVVSIWALDMAWLKRLSVNGVHAVLGSYRENPRHMWQWGAFTRNGEEFSDLREAFVEGAPTCVGDWDCAPPAIIRFDLPLSQRAAAIEDLALMRINSMTIFPGLEGVVQWIREGGSAPTG